MLHNRRFTKAAVRSGRCEVRAQRVRPKIVDKPGGRHARLHDLPNRPRRQVHADRTVPVDALKDAPLREGGCGEPRGHIPTLHARLLTKSCVTVCRQITPGNGLAWDVHWMCGEGIESPKHFSG